MNPPAFFWRRFEDHLPYDLPEQQRKLLRFAFFNGAMTMMEIKSESEKEVAEGMRGFAVQRMEQEVIKEILELQDWFNAMVRESRGEG